MKLTYEDKVQIYELRKQGQSFNQLQYHNQRALVNQFQHHNQQVLAYQQLHQLVIQMLVVILIIAKDQPQQIDYILNLHQLQN